MTVSSPEEQRDAALQDLRKVVERIDPLEHAVSYLSMSGDEEADQALLVQHRLGSEHPIVSLEELADAFDRDYKLATAYLAEFWEVNQRLIPWPADGSQSIARYLAQLKNEEYLITVTKWLQPHPFTDDTGEMVGMCIDPKWSLSPVRHMIYLDKTPIFSCKYNSLDAPQHLETEWGKTELLTRDDVMIAEKVVKRIAVHFI